MKRTHTITTLKKYYLLFFLSLLPLAAIADDSGGCGENVYYSYDSTTHTLTIYGDGPMYDFDDGVYFPWYLYSGDILHLIIKSGVTSIPSYAFSYCDNVTSIIISKSVTNFSDMAFPFNGWKDLISIIVEDGNPFYDSRESCNAIINSTSNELILGCVNTTIPSSVSSIGEKAFGLCSNLTSVTIPNSVTKIGSSAFSGCTGLTSIISEIENPFVISSTVFSGIPSYAQLIVPKGTKAAYQATEGWNQFTNIIEYEKRRTIHVATAGTLPDLIQNYEKNLIEELTLTGELNGTDLAFLREMAGQSRWIWFHFENANIFDLKSGEGLTLETQGKLINLDISNATIVSGGGPSLQLQGTGFTNIYSSDNTIPAGLFHDCRLTFIKLPQNVSIIESLAFGNCPLTSIIIPSSVEIIGRSAFWGCSSLESIVVENGNTKYDSRNNCEAIIETESNTLIAGCKNTIIPSNVTSIGNDAFGVCSGLTSITIPNSVTSIGSEAFRYCSGLTSVTIPNSVTSIGGSAFYGTAWYNNQPEGLVYAGKVAYNYKGTMPANTSISLKEGTLGIAGHAFDYCEGLSSITIPNSVTSIGEGAFWGCSGLTSITIPNSVKTMGNHAFYSSGLTTIVSEIDKPFKIENTVFNGIPSDAQLIVPKGTKAAYQATEGWNRFTNIVEAGETGPDQPGQIHINNIYFKVTESGEAEVVSAENRITNITIPSTVSYNNTSYKVMSIAKDAFENCEQLSAVIWEPEVQFNAKVNNPNFLLYVSDEKYASRSVKNVVVNGVAESIELTDAANGNDFYCPIAFKARSIVYSHNYQMETGIGDSRGWETIVLPFDVQKYTHATKGELESFTTWSKGSSKKPFWLFELTASGYKDVAGIKANTPYIISMPNNQQYEQQYQIPGVVTFSALNVEVQKSDNLKPGSYQGRSLVPNYMNKDGGECLPLNVNNYYVTNPGKDISGSKFVRGLRAVHPFEAYMTTTDNTRSIDVIEGMTTAIRGIQMVNDGAGAIKVYDTRGILMKTATSIDDVKNGLKAGVYIVNGKKMIIK